jgi:hypothetical protein
MIGDNHLHTGTRDQQISLAYRKPLIISKSKYLLDVTPCSLVEVYQRFGGKYYSYLQDRGMNKTKIQLFLYLFVRLLDLHSIPKFKHSSVPNIGNFLSDYKASHSILRNALILNPSH